MPIFRTGLSNFDVRMTERNGQLLNTLFDLAVSKKADGDLGQRLRGPREEPIGGACVDE